MSYRTLPRASANDNPEQLLRLFNFLVVTSFVVILAVAGTAIYWIYSSAMLHRTETAVIGIAKAVMSAEVDSLLTEDGNGALRIAIAPDDMRQVDAHLRRYLKFFNLAKLAIFDADRRVVYSTVPTEIGRTETDATALNDVLEHGKPRAEVRGKLEPGELGNALPTEPTLVIESHYPILDARGHSLGAFEVYVDVSDTQDEIVRVLTLSLGALSLVLAICLFSLYRPMKRGTEKIIAANANLAELATRDHLTGLFNRRHIADRVKQEFNRWRRGSSTAGMRPGIGFIMADIDHFKRINDSYGHAVGDEVLREVANRIQEGLREYDMLGRYGGEEFLVMLPNSDLAAVALVAERLRWAVGSREIILASGEALTVTISMGAACAVDGSLAEQEVIHQADVALYRAKELGRNRVEVYATPADAAHSTPSLRPQSL
ncbi:diguanylate cyclase [Azoarcus sp. KH32C]|uniref:GGDEF domain-containing protein n=1 Tax=Azoarcus sp. KH32C TaxID=748247 RepID=UPI0002385C24|nr:GGDEF domain-containing protein [Azoarcus sp. KH32C]BAL26863.1 diguanylate cyclase [Azoarcus sp. KH32C]